MCRFALKRFEYLLVCVAIAALGGYDETFTIHARSYEQWNSLSDVEKSFFPLNLPTTAHDIYAIYEPDSSARISLLKSPRRVFPISNAL
jgi:hypothetical protein